MEGKLGVDVRFGSRCGERIFGGSILFSSARDEGDETGVSVGISSMLASDARGDSLTYLPSSGGRSWYGRQAVEPTSTDGVAGGSACEVDPASAMLQRHLQGPVWPALALRRQVRMIHLLTQRVWTPVDRQPSPLDAQSGQRATVLLPHQERGAMADPKGHLNPHSKR